MHARLAAPPNAVPTLRRVRFGTALAWLLVLPWALWAVVRVLGLDRGWPLVGIVAFTPYAVGGALAGTLIALALKRVAAAVVGAVALLLLAAVVAPRVVGSPEEARAGDRPLRVLTLNIQHANARADAVVELVRRKRVDLLFVQEYTVDAGEALEASGLDRVLPESVTTPGPGEARETAIFGRVRLRRVPSPGEARLWTAAVARAPGGRQIEVHSVHPKPPISRAAQRSWRAELRSMPSAESPRFKLLAGDFNATLDHRELRAVLAGGYVDAAEQAGAGLHTTWPVGRRIPPTITIDHVLADERLGVGDVSIHEIPGTDHRAVFAELFVPAR